VGRVVVPVGADLDPAQPIDACVADVSVNWRAFTAIKPFGRHAARTDVSCGNPSRALLMNEMAQSVRGQHFARRARFIVTVSRQAPQSVSKRTAPASAGKCPADSSAKVEFPDPFPRRCPLPRPDKDQRTHFRCTRSARVQFLGDAFHLQNKRGHAAFLRPKGALGATNGPASATRPPGQSRIETL